MYNNICTTIIAHIILLILGEIWRKRSNLTSLLPVVVFAQVGKVNVEVLNIKSYQPRQNVFLYSSLGILFAAGKNAEIRGLLSSVASSGFRLIFTIDSVQKCKHKFKQEIFSVWSKEIFLFLSYFLKLGIWLWTECVCLCV